MNAQEAIQELHHLTDKNGTQLVDITDIIAAALGITTLLGKQYLKDSLADCVDLDKRPNDPTSYGIFGMVVRIDDAMKYLRKTFHTRKRSRKQTVTALKLISRLARLAQMIEEKEVASDS